MLSALQPVQRQRQMQQPVQRQRQMQQPVQKRLQEPTPALEQEQVRQQAQVQVQVLELRLVFRRKRSRQEPTGQQQEQRVSLSIPRELKLKSANFYPTLKMHPGLITGMHTKSKAAYSSTWIQEIQWICNFFCYNPSLVVNADGRETAHISIKRDFNTRAFSGSCCARMPRGSSKWKRRT